MEVNPMISEILKDLADIDNQLKDSLKDGGNETFRSVQIVAGCGGCYGTQITCPSTSIIHFK